MRCVAALLLAVLAHPAASQEDPGTAEERRAYDWFQSLGFPDLSEAPFVRFYTGQWEQADGDPPRAVPDHGFLLEDRDGAFRVFTFGLARVTVRKRAGAKPHERVGYERTSFKEYVRSGLAELKTPATAFPCRREPFGHLEYSPPLLFRLFTVANACASRRQPVLAHEVWQELRREIRTGDDETPVLDVMKRDIGAEAYRNLILDFGDPQRSFSDQLAGFRWWRDKFGQDERVNEAIEILEKMVAEEATAPADPVARLIHGLRAESESGRGSASRKLVDLGFRAVPQLIDALGDRRFTRSAGCGMTGEAYLRAPVTATRVGDLARSILLEISTLQSFQARDGDGEGLREEVQRWWDEARTKTERDYLVARVEAAERYVVLPARRLLGRYPDAAEDAILRGLERATDGNARYGLVLCLKTIESDRVTAALLREVKTTEPRCRLLVAWLLLARGHDEGVRAVIQIWRGSGSARGEAAHFLCHCGRLAALEALREDLADRPTRDRFRVVWSLREDWSPRFVAKERITLDAGWHAAVEAFLVSVLPDTGEMTGMSIGSGENYFRDPRVCDVAASALARRFPGKYAFDRTGTRANRERQRLRAANTWRREHGLEPLAGPRPREVGRLDPATGRRLRSRVLSGSDRRAALDAVEAHGVAALRTVQEWLAELPQHHDARDELEALARRLACRVVAVEYANGSAQPDRALRATLAGLEGTTLSAEAFVGIMTQATRQLPDNTTGIELTAARNGNGTGVVLGVNLSVGRSTSTNWVFSTRLDVGDRRVIHVTRGSTSLDYVRSRDYWSDISGKLEEALASAPATPFEVIVRIVR